MDFTKIKNWTINGAEVVKTSINGVVVWVKNRLLKSIAGNSVQDGVPTPSAPIPIQFVGDKTVNLLEDLNDNVGKSITKGGITFTTNKDGSITLNGTSTTNNVDFYIEGVGANYGNAAEKVYEAGKYAIKPSTVTGAALFCVFYKDSSTSVTNTRGFTLDWNTERVRTFIRVATTGTAFNNDVYYPMLMKEENYTAEYEPYTMHYKIPITIQEGNFYKLSPSTIGYTYQCNLIFNDDNSIIVNATGTDCQLGGMFITSGTYNDKCGAKIYVKENETYYLDIGNPCFNKNFIVYFDKDDNVISYAGLNSSKKTFIPPVGTSYACLRIGYGEAKIGESYVINPTISLIEPKESILFLKEPLRKVGDYADEITTDKIIRRVLPWQLNGVTAGHKINNVALTGDVYRSTASNINAYIPNTRPISDGRSIVTSDQYTYGAVGNYPSTAFMYRTNSLSSTLYIIHNNQSLTTITQVNDALAVERPTFYIPVTDTDDYNFIWADDINVPVGATITFDTTVQPSDYILEQV